MYVVLDDMVIRYPLAILAQLTDDTNGATVDSAVLNVLIAEAETIVHGYLRDRYALPLTLCPEDVKGCICAIAYYKAHRRRADTPPQGVTDQFNNAIDYLQKVQRGSVLLNVAGNVADVPTVPSIVTNKQGGKVMANLIGRMP